MDNIIRYSIRLEKLSLHGCQRISKHALQRIHETWDVQEFMRRHANAAEDVGSAMNNTGPGSDSEESEETDVAGREGPVHDQGDHAYD